MIKKVLLVLGLLFFPFCSFAFDQNFYLNLPATLQDGQNNDLELLKNVNFLLNDEYNYISVYGGGLYPRLKSVFWTRDGLYFVRSCAGGYYCTNINTSIEMQGYVQNVLKCDITDINCSTSPISLNFSEFTSNSDFGNPDYMILNDNQWNNTTLNMCLVYESQNLQICIPFDQVGLSDSIGFTFNPLPSQIYSSGDQISSYFFSSPFQSSNNSQITGGVIIDGFDYISIHTGNYISYWEDKGFNQDMCYVGTRDLSGVYEDRLTYYQGTGYTIFDTYSKLFNLDSFSISQIGTFINNWLINYDTWFLGKNRYIDGSPYYNMIYNSPSDNYVDRGPNLTNIFVGNKAVYYFLASTIRDRSSYIEDGTIGEEVATYCYYKLTRYSNVSNDGQVYNINDDHDSSYDSNVAVYVGNKLIGIGSGVSFSGANVINSQSWDGSVLDYFTGENYTDFNSFFSSSFNRFKYLFNLQNGDYGLGFLPSYIIIFLLGIIFFRFLRH